MNYVVAEVTRMKKAIVCPCGNPQSRRKSGLGSRELTVLRRMVAEKGSEPKEQTSGACGQAAPLLLFRPSLSQKGGERGKWRVCACRDWA